MTCKPARTYEEQVLILEKEHGLNINDKEYAAKSLSVINYYNLRGYYIHWMDSKQLFFRPGITFEMLLRLRDFDEQLRNLLWPLLLHVEIRFRTHIAYYIAHKYGPLGYRNVSNFASAKFAQDIITEIDKAIDKSDREIFIRHYKQNYNSEFPIWIIVEVLPFGVLSKLYSNLINVDKTNIAKEHYELDGGVVNSYLAALSSIRNICAHNGRIYNKMLPAGVIVSSSNKRRLQSIYGVRYIDRCIFPDAIFDRSLFAILLALRDLTSKNNFRMFVKELDCLLIKYKDVACPQRLGLPMYWQDFLIESVTKQK